MNHGAPEFTVRPSPTKFVETTHGSETVHYAYYNVPDFVRSNNVLNLDLKFRDHTQGRKVLPPPLTATRFQTGYGQATGGIACIIYNNHPTKEIVISYLEVIPWFIRTYFHTLKVEHFQSLPMDIRKSGIELKPLQIHYHPGKDRQRPYHLELVVRLPASSITRISFEFERQLLKWTEYPPDANHGFYIGSAVIGAILPDAQNVTAPLQSSSTLATLLESNNSTSEVGYFMRLYTVPLLVSLPTPDFSMPYNVICLACTVIAIAFGSIHNLTTRRFVYFDSTKHKGLLTKIKEKIKQVFQRRKTEQIKGSQESQETLVNDTENAETQKTQHDTPVGNFETEH